MENKFFPMTFHDFLALVRCIKMLYGRTVAEKYFTKHIDEWYNLGSESLTKSGQ